MEARERYHHGDLRNALVGTATRLVEERGSAALSLREVATRIGVSPSAVYRHFRDKDALLVAVALDAFAALHAAFPQTADDAAPGAARVTAASRAYVAFALAHPELYRLMLGAHRPRDPALLAAGLETLAVFRRLLAAMLGADADDPDVMRRVVAGWSLVHGYIMLRLEGPLAGLPGVRELDVEELFGALAVPPGA